MYIWIIKLFAWKVDRVFSSLQVTCSNDFNLKLWDVKTGEEKVTFTGHMAAVSDVAYKVR